MALSYEQQRPVRTTLTGVGLVIVPPRDATTNIPWTGEIEIERAPDSGGAPGAWAMIAKVDAFPSAGGRYIDPRPLTTSTWWYRYRPVRAGGVGSYSDAVSAQAGIFPRGMRAGLQAGDAATFYAGVRGDPMSDGEYAVKTTDTVGKPLRSQVYTDGKFALKASDTVGKETDDDLFIAAAKTLKVGTAASPSVITKTIRVPYGEFLPRDVGQSWFLDTYARPNTTNVDLLMQAPVVLPPGVTVTKFRIRSYRQTVSDTANAGFNRLDDSGFTSLATANHASTGWVTIETSLSEVVGSNGYMIGVGLKGAAAVANARLQYAEIEYTMPSYDKGY